jgi:hypothetical protein
MMDACRARNRKDALWTGVKNRNWRGRRALLQLVRETDNLKSEDAQVMRKQSEQDSRLEDAGMIVRELATARISTEKGIVGITSVVYLDEPSFDGTVECEGEQIRIATKKNAGFSLSLDDTFDLSEIASDEKEKFKLRRDGRETEDIRFKVNMEQEQRTLEIMESKLALLKEEAEARHYREIEAREDPEENRKYRAIDRQERLFLLKNLFEKK